MDSSDNSVDARSFTRRDILTVGASAWALGAATMTRAANSPGAGVTRDPPAYAKDTETGNMRDFSAIHAGKSSVSIKRFAFDGHTAPANFIIYDIPPGASEGVHVHHLDNRNREGAFDEYYYIVSGMGQMLIDGAAVPVAAGDHVHTPLDVAHGIENTHSSEHLKIFLTFIDRAAKS